MEPEENRSSHGRLRWAMNLSLWVGVALFAIKVGAYLITGSAAILSDAAESVVHLVAVGFAAYSLRVSHRPADSGHLYGHAKVGFFSSGFEGAMILFAATYIIYQAISMWIGGLVLRNLGAGMVMIVLAVVVNGTLGLYLLRIGKKHQSIVLEANGRHVLTDCWTSFGVVVGLNLAGITGWLAWDPICAIVVAANIVVSGITLMRRSVRGLMDRADPKVQAQLVGILEKETRMRGIGYHSLRHRNLGRAHWVDVHFLFPEETPIRDAHHMATEVERKIREALVPEAHVQSHLEASEDHADIHPGGHRTALA